MVFDTSVWISALLWMGLSHRILELAYEGRIVLCITLPLLQELEEVLSRPKFASILARRNTDVAELIVGVAALAEFHEPAPIVGVVPEDPDDDAVIACAVASKARWIVSGDKLCYDSETTTEFASVRREISCQQNFQND